MGCDQIFGPVLSLGKFSSEAEAIALANDTTYGLGAGLHSSERAVCRGCVCRADAWVGR